MIYIIQPAVPKYRVSFFDKINIYNDITIYSTEKDFLGVKSSSNANYIKYVGSFAKICNSRIFWHRKLPIWRGYKKNDVVIVNGNPRIINYMILMFTLKLRGIKVIWWGHGWSAGSHGISASVRLRLMYLLSDYQLVYTDHEKCLLAKDTVYALNNGLDSDLIKNAISRINSENNKCSFSERTALFFIGRVSEKSNFSFLLEALHRVKGDFVLHVIGSNSSELLGSYPNLRDKVIWHGEIYNEEDIAKIIIDLDVFVYPGSVGLSLIHAFNYGKPAIIHDSADHHMPEFSAFSQGVNGYAYQYGNLHSFVEKLEAILMLSKDELRILSEGARNSVRNTYNVNDMVLRFNKLISKVNQCTIF